MGPAIRDKDTVALICRRSLHTSGPLKIDEQTEWQIGYVKDTFNELLIVQYEDGIKEPVDSDRCIFAPTPFVLAHRLQCCQVRNLLWDRWVEWSLQLGLDEAVVEEEAREGALPLGTAAACGKYQVISKYAQEIDRDPICEELCRPDSLGRTALHRAARGGCLITIQTVGELIRDHNDLQKSLAHQDIEGCNALHHAVASKNEQCLLEVLHLAKSRGTNSVSDLLVAHDTWCRSPLHLAAQTDQTAAIRILLDAGDDLDRTMGSTELKDLSIVLTPQADCNMTTWRIGKIWSQFGPEVTVRYESKEQQRRMDTHSFIVGPTPLDLAQKCGCSNAAVMLQERRERENRMSPGFFPKAVRKAMCVSLLETSSVTKGRQMMARHARRLSKTM